MEYNIITNNKIIREIKSYRGFRVSLGYANFAGNQGEKSLNEKDKFAYYYNTANKTTIFGQGYIGDINFYVDHYIIKDKLLIYLNKEEFPFEFDWKKVEDKGIEWYLGSLLKNIHDHLDKKDEIEKQLLNIEKKGDPYKIINNPGSVTFEDIKAFQEAKRKGLI